MKHSSIYGSALIIGALGGIITMLFHPTGHDLLGQPDEIARRGEMLTVATHSLAIFSFPVLFFGLLGFSRQIDRTRPLVSAALIAYAVGMFAGICAAVINGLVAPVITRQMLTADESDGLILRQILMNNTLLNQAFTKVFVAASSLAIIFWSVSIARKSRFAQLISIYGSVLGIINLLGLFSGHLSLNVHGFGLIIFGQSLWTMLLGVFLFHLNDSPQTEPSVINDSTEPI